MIKMGKLYQIACVMISIILFGMTIGFALQGEPMNVEQKEEIPMVRFKLGDSTDDIREQSSYSFKELNERSKQSTQIGTQSAHYVVYDYPEHPITFPVGLFFLGDIVMNTVVNAGFTPQLEYLSLEDSLILVEDLINRIDNAGWERVERKITPYPTFDEIRSLYYDPKTSKTKQKFIQTWEMGDETLDLIIKRSWQMGDHTPRDPYGVPYDQFLVNVKIADRNLSKSAYREWGALQRQRKSDNSQ